MTNSTKKNSDSNRPVRKVGYFYVQFVKTTFRRFFAEAARRSSQCPNVWFENLPKARK